MFNIARKNDINRCALLSDVRGLKKTVYFEHNFSAVNSMTHKKGLEIKREMETEIFDDIVADKFDFLNIDLEGQDYKVLKSIDEMVKSDDPKMVFEKYKHLYTKLSNTKKVLPVSKHEFF